MQKFIIIGDEESKREVIVYKGSPYYKSTGENSGEKDLWFPFIMMVGSKPINLAELPEIYNKSLFIAAYRDAKQKKAFYLVKHETALLLQSKTEQLKTKLYDGRIPTKECLIISARLSHPHPAFIDKRLHEIGLNEVEIESTKQKIDLATNPELLTSDPDEINEWLIKEGAIAASALLKSSFQTSNVITLFHPKEEKEVPGLVRAFPEDESSASNEDEASFIEKEDSDESVVMHETDLGVEKKESSARVLNLFEENKPTTVTSSELEKPSTIVSTQEKQKKKCDHKCQII